MHSINVDDCATGGINSNHCSCRSRLGISKPICSDRQSLNLFTGEWRYKSALNFDIYGAIGYSCQNAFGDQRLIVAKRSINQSRERLHACGHIFTVQALP